ncbi:MAG: HAMP domain-containing protein [Deltaproteobacteria bacterium]|nr:HAMP domain-containing protein [Deltaproteobacteria bacterium]
MPELSNNIKEALGPSPEPQRKIRNRIGLIIFCFILIISLLSFNYYQQGLEDWSSIDFNLNIFLLINLNILLLVTVILLIIRNLVKLIYERKRRKLGFRLKFKLTLAFVLVSSLPMLMFFFIANGLLRDSLDFWFKGQFALALKDSAGMVERLNQYQADDLKHLVKIVADDYKKDFAIEPSAGNSGKLPKEWFRNTLARYRLDGIIWYDANLVPGNSWFLDNGKKEAWKPLVKNDLIDKLAEFPMDFDCRTLMGKINRALMPVSIKGAVYYLEVAKLQTGSKYKNLGTIQQNLENFQKLANLQSPISTNFTTYLLLFTVLIIGVGIWFGYYLAGSIVRPIETLVDGTRRIAKGDLDFQIDLEVDDETGMLLDSFNAMTKELQQNRKKLAISREALVYTNKTLEERNIFVELVQQNIQTGIISVDNSGYINGINPYMIRLFQIKHTEVIQKHYLSILTKEQKEHFEEMLDLLNQSGQTSVKKITHLTVEKRVVRVSMELFQLKNPQREQLGKLLVVDDFTEIDRSTRDSAWREVARRIAHEIKNPLTPIQLSTQRIRRKYLEVIDDSEMLDSCTSTIIKEVNGLKKMVNEFSKFARLPEISPSPNNINRILENVSDLFKQGLPPLIKINLTTDPTIPETLLDAEQMKRVFTNLIDNAVAAITGAGKIDLISSYAKELKMVSVKVVDTGSGIPAEMLHRIFDPYVTTKKDGTGLGLAIVQQIISDHDGFIRLQNNDSGTTFTIELPA